MISPKVVLCLAAGLTASLFCGCAEQAERPTRPVTNTAPSPSRSEPADAELPRTYAPDSAEPQHITANKVIEESREAWNAAEEFAAQSKDEFLAESKRRLSKLDRKIAEYQRRFDEKADTASAELRAKWQEDLRDLEARRQEMRQEIDKLSKSGGAAWSDLSDGARKAWKNLSESFHRAARHFDSDHPATTP